MRALRPWDLKILAGAVLGLSLLPARGDFHFQKNGVACVRPDATCLPGSLVTCWEENFTSLSLRPLLFSACWCGADTARSELARARHDDLQRFPFPEGNPLDFCRRLGMGEDSPQVLYLFQKIALGRDPSMPDTNRSAELNLRALYPLLQDQLSGKSSVAVKFYAARPAEAYDDTDTGVRCRSLPHGFLLRDLKRTRGQEIVLDTKDNPSRTFALQMVLPGGDFFEDLRSIRSVIGLFQGVDADDPASGVEERRLPRVDTARAVSPTPRSGSAAPDPAEGGPAAAGDRYFLENGAICALPGGSLLPESFASKWRGSFEIPYDRDTRLRLPPLPLFRACWCGADLARSELAQAWHDDLQRFPFPEGNPLDFCRRLGIEKNSPQMLYTFQIIPVPELDYPPLNGHPSLVLSPVTLYSTLYDQLKEEYFIAAKLYGARTEEECDDAGAGPRCRSLPHGFLKWDILAGRKKIFLDARDNPSRIFALQMVLPRYSFSENPQSISSVLHLFYAVDADGYIPGRELLPRTHTERAVFRMLGPKTDAQLPALNEGKPRLLWPADHRYLQTILAPRQTDASKPFPRPLLTGLHPYDSKRSQGTVPVLERCLLDSTQGALPADRTEARARCGDYFHVDALPEEVFRFLSSAGFFGKIRIGVHVQHPIVVDKNTRIEVCLLRPHHAILGGNTAEFQARYAMKLFGAQFQDAWDDERGGDEHCAGFLGERSHLPSGFFLKTVWRHRNGEGAMATSPDNCHVAGTDDIHRNFSFWSVVLGRCLGPDGHWEAQNTALVTLHIALSEEDSGVAWDFIEQPHCLRPNPHAEARILYKLFAAKHPELEPAPEAPCTTSGNIFFDFLRLLCPDDACASRIIGEIRQEIADEAAQEEEAREE